MHDKSYITNCCLSLKRMFFYIYIQSYVSHEIIHKPLYVHSFLIYSTYMWRPEGDRLTYISPRRLCSAHNFLHANPFFIISYFYLIKVTAEDEYLFKHMKNVTMSYNMKNSYNHECIYKSHDHCITWPTRYYVFVRPIKGPIFWL